MGLELENALERLTVPDVCEAAGHRLEFVRRGVDTGLARSPFPDKHKHGDRNPSFFVVPESGGRAWINYATSERGGVWELAKAFWPRLSAGDLASQLIDLAGTRESGGPTLKTRQEVAKEHRRRQREARRAMEEREAAKVHLPPAGEAIAAPAFVWEEFEAAREIDEAAAEGLAAERGWPVDWVLELSSSKLSRPDLPWGGGRGWAFAVEAPLSDQGGKTCFIGYHQRFHAGGGKSWLFVPHKPRSAKARLQKDLAQWYAGDGCGRAVPPAPFALGDLDLPQLVVITEGQWDAATVYGALGGFDDGDPIEVACFGLRGVRNCDEFLKWWGRWLMRVAERGDFRGVWVIADSDRAGEPLWKTVYRSGGPPELSFADRLRAIFGCRVVVSHVRRDGVKDFNDWYRDQRMTPAEMWGLLKGLRLA